MNTKVNSVILPGAELIVLDTIPQRIGEIERDKPVIFICRSGNRSAQASSFAQENGFTNVYNMRGGMLLWNEKNFEVEGKIMTARTSRHLQNVERKDLIST